MEFEKRKAAALAAMACAESDKSPKGSIDTPIIPLLETLNSHPSFFTTSSCSGRISILSQPSTAAAAAKSKKARGGSWLYITHEPAEPTSVVNLLFPSVSAQLAAERSDLVLRFEPLIVAVECRDVGSARSLVSLAISSGFRESGITSAGNRVIVAIRCSIRLEVPLGDTSRILVSEEYVRYLVGIANEKMEANRQRTEGFLQALRGNGFKEPAVPKTGDKESPSAALDDKNGLVCNKAHVCDDKEDQSVPLQRAEGDADHGSSRYLGCSLSIVQMTIVGEPLEKLFLWGHSTCNLGNTQQEKLLVFGGFGGIGRHARRNDSLLLDPFYNALKSIDTNDPPCPRLGHTSCMVGRSMFVIGGRSDPTKILNDVWVFDTAENKWRLSRCGGCYFPPRHRHAAAVIGSKIYVFGGLNDDSISSSIHVLDTEKLQWNEIGVHGEWPSARHSHSLVAYDNQLFMFGGHNGEKALGDLYSFNTETSMWKRENIAGKYPYARFSHSMFVYKHFIGIIGGCPVRQHCQELALLDVRLRLWKLVILNSGGKELFVRSTSSIIGDDLIVVGGGASCYAFGTTFSKLVKINLIPLLSFDDPVVPSSAVAENAILRTGSLGKMVGSIQDAPDVVDVHVIEALNLNIKSNLSVLHAGNHGWVLKIEKTNAKLAKDILKSFGWLDLGKKVYSKEDRMHICFPITEKFCAMYVEKQHKPGQAFESLNGHFLESYKTGEVLLKNVSVSTALDLLMAYGALMVPNDDAQIRKASKSPFKLMTEAVDSLIKRKGLPDRLLEQLPTRWERLGDIVVLPVSSFRDPLWNMIKEELWLIVANSVNTRRLARQGQVAPRGTRDSTLEILVGDDGWVNHRENGILYSFDATKCMFSWGNLSEKLRMAHLDCKDEVVVDLFAGIGYFTLPFLVRANAKLVYACEWNPYAIEALQHNLQANSVANRCVVLEGDNRLTAPKGVADRVCLGLLPTSEDSWSTAVRALRVEGGVLHVHGNVKDVEEVSWSEYVSNSINDIAKSEGYGWEVSVEHVERVKWYAPHIRHLVADVKCKQIHR